jgi:hypothetical protein
VYSQVEVSAMGQCLVQMTRADCDVSECDYENLNLRRTRLTRDVQLGTIIEERNKIIIIVMII